MALITGMKTRRRLGLLGLGLPLALGLVACTGRPALSEDAVQRVLSHEHRCGPSLVLRS